MVLYRVPQLDATTRQDIALHMLRPRKDRWGYVKHRAEKWGVSRQTLYTIRDRIQKAITEALEPQRPGPRSDTQILTIDEDYVRQAIAILALQKGSVRDIQRGLELLLGVERSIGTISETLQGIGESAAEYLLTLRPAEAIQGELDEIFQKQQPCLSVVDALSFLVVNLTAAEDRSKETWSDTLTELLGRDITFSSVVSDEAGGIQAGVKEAGLYAIWQADWFHILHEGHRVTRTLENSAYRAMKQAERASETSCDALRAIETYDLWCWLFSELRFSLQSLHGYQLNDPARARETLQAACDLMHLLENKAISTFASRILNNLDNLLAPLRRLAEQIAPWSSQLHPDDEALIIWTYRDPELTITDLPEVLHEAACAYHQALSLLHRTSSHVEAFHSYLRPYLDIHRTLPGWLLPLAALFWNHHTFQRGKRAGYSPAQLARCQNALSLQDVLQLVCAMAFGSNQEVPSMAA